ncbi:MAG: hypothetical protein ACE5RC_08350 [Nitrosopumilus sp.]
MNDIYDVFVWLNLFYPSKLVSPIKDIRDQIAEKINSNNISSAIEAYQALEYLKFLEGDRIDTFERGEIWAECGLLFYQLGNPFEAQTSLLKALENYPPGSHEYAVVCWMLGIVQWSLENKHGDAMKNWNLAIERFDQLKIQAEYTRQNSLVVWYLTRIDEMVEGLREKVREKFS